MPTVKNPIVFGRTARVSKIFGDSYAQVVTDTGKQVMLFFGNRYSVVNHDGEKLLDHFAQTQRVPCNTGIETGSEIVFSKLIYCGEDDHEVEMWIPMEEFLQHAKVGDTLLYATSDRLGNS